MKYRINPTIEPLEANALPSIATSNEHIIFIRYFFIYIYHCKRKIKISQPLPLWKLEPVAPKGRNALKSQNGMRQVRARKPFAGINHILRNHRSAESSATVKMGKKNHRL